ncbi:glycosyltransferase family 64 protein, partial [Backusella circina FSU 941]
IKPWNFHAYSQVDWKKYYDPIGFYKWRRTNNELRRIIDPCKQRQICDKYIQSSNPNVFPVENKFSVLISTYNPDRIEHLSLIIRHLLKSKKVHTVFVTWHNPELDVPENLIKDRRVKVLRQSYDSLNNRFNPVKDLVTDSVYIMDDDIYLDLADLEFTFDIWRSRKDSVVGHFPRLHEYNPDTLEADYNLIGKAPYTIILTKSMFIRSDYLFAYTCLLEPRLHEAVDEHLNCEDLGFSMMASGLSGVGSSFVHPEKPLEDFGLAKGISINNSHMPTRSLCISDFITKFWNRKDPLIRSYDTVVAFKKPQIKTGDWNRVEKLIG